MAGNELLRLLGIQNPIIQGPMGGGPSTPELVAAASNVGGLGSLGASYLTPDQLATAIRRIRELTDKPFNVNLFAGGIEAANQVDPQPMLDLLTEIHERLGLPRPSLPVLKPDSFPEQFEVMLEARPPIFSFTFGIPDPEKMRRLKARGITILGTATTVAEARMLADTGVDGIVAQGSEAGAHRGTFATKFEAAMVPTLELTRGIRDAVAVPVIASGGLMDGRDIAAAMASGASAAQLGTAFLACSESGASDAYKRAILAAREDTTVVTRAFSGRPARGLVNDFIKRLAGREEIILPFPLQNALTRAMRTAAAQRGEPGFLSLWAGQGVARSRAMPAAKFVQTLVKEIEEVQGSTAA